MNTKLRIAAALVALAVAGCAEPPPPAPDNTGTEIPITVAPEFGEPEELSGFPDFYRRARCVIVAPPGDLRDEEFENFVDRFQEQFFGVCFQAIDTDVVNKARARSSVFAGVPPSDRLTQMANESQADFTLYIDLSLRNQAIDASDGVQRRDIAGKVRGRATAKLVGGQAKDAKELSTTLQLDQIFSTPRKQELRGGLASTMGNALARKLLAQAGSAKGVSAETVVTLRFKFFDDVEKRNLREELFKIKGIDPSASSGRSAGGSELFTILINTTRNMTELRQDIEYMLEDNNFAEASVQQVSATELLIKAR